MFSFAICCKLMGVRCLWYCQLNSTPLYLRWPLFSSLARTPVPTRYLFSQLLFGEDFSMYHKEKSIQIKNSASALYNNLSVMRIAPRRLTYFTVVHANVVHILTKSWLGINDSIRQPQSIATNVATSTSLIMQVRPQLLQSELCNLIRLIRNIEIVAFFFFK